MHFSYGNAQMITNFHKSNARKRISINITVQKVHSALLHFFDYKKSFVTKSTPEDGRSEDAKAA